jgi:hypothetical protein
MRKIWLFTADLRQGQLLMIPGIKPNIRLRQSRFEDPLNAMELTATGQATLSTRVDCTHGSNVAMYVAISGENASPDTYKRLSRANKQSDALFRNSSAAPEPYACNMKHTRNCHIRTGRRSNVSQCREYVFQYGTHFSWRRNDILYVVTIVVVLLLLLLLLKSYPRNGL